MITIKPALPAGEPPFPAVPVLCKLYELLTLADDNRVKLRREGMIKNCQPSYNVGRSARAWLETYPESKRRFKADVVSLPDGTEIFAGNDTIAEAIATLGYRSNFKFGISSLLDRKAGGL